MLVVILWKWTQLGHRAIYTFDHVNIVARQLRENIAQPFRLVLVTDDGEGVEKPTEIFPLWDDHNTIPNVTGRHLPSCYRRLKLFDRPTQEAMGIAIGDLIVSLDLDSIVLNPLDDMLRRFTDSGKIFAGWAKLGTFHRMVYNGSFWAMRGGDHLQHIWSGFNPALSPRETLAQGWLGSDQGWLSRHFAKNEDSFPIRGPELESYPQVIRPQRKLDRRTLIAFFHGARKPWHRAEHVSAPWITAHWHL